MTRVKVVHLTSVHPVHDTRIFHRECKTLAAAGYDVVLLAPHHRETMEDGVRVRPVPTPRGRRDRMLRTVGSIYLAARRERAQVYHFHDPELIPVGILLKLQGARVITDVHEDVPLDILTKFWLPPWLRRPLAWLVRRLEVLAALFVDAVVAATPVIARRFPAGKTFLLPNYPIAGEWDAINSSPYAERPPVVAYVGKIAAIRGAKEMVEAVRLVADVPGIRLALAGEFAPAELERELRSALGWQRVDSLGFLTRPQVGQLLGRSRVGLVLLHPAPNHTEAQPNKLFEYMAAGLPVIASSFPLWKELIEGLDCGLVVDPLDPGEIARAIAAILGDPVRAEAMGRRGREAVAKQYNWSNEAGRLLSLYERLTLGDRGPALRP